MLGVHVNLGGVKLQELNGSTFSDVPVNLHAGDGHNGHDALPVPCDAAEFTEGINAETLMA